MSHTARLSLLPPSSPLEEPPARTTEVFDPLGVDVAGALAVVATAAATVVALGFVVVAVVVGLAVDAVAAVVGDGRAVVGDGRSSCGVVVGGAVVGGAVVVVGAAVVVGASVVVVGPAVVVGATVVVGSGAVVVLCRAPPDGAHSPVSTDVRSIAVPIRRQRESATALLCPSLTRAGYAIPNDPEV